MPVCVGGASGTAFPFVSFMILNPPPLLPTLLRDRQRTGDAVCGAEAEWQWVAYCEGGTKRQESAAVCR